MRGIGDTLTGPWTASGIALLMAVVLTGGCGGKESPDITNGKRLFTGEGRCGSCHTLARAGTGGVIGPNLDEAFGPSRRAGLGEETIEEVVYIQIGNVRKGSVMPEDLVTGDDARDVAAYVGKVAGKPGKDSGLLASVGTSDSSNKTTTAKAGKLTIPADPTGALAFQFGKATSKPGKVTISMPNPASIQHNIAIEGLGKGPVVGQGGDSTFSATLKPGKYEYICEVPGHAEGGMKGTLTVK